MNNDAVRRSHKIVELLAGRYFDGLSNKELAAHLRTSAVNISRDMRTLEEMGYARLLDTGRWALTSRPIAVAHAFETHYKNLQLRMQESTHNIYAVAQQLAKEGRI